MQKYRGKLMLFLVTALVVISIDQMIFENIFADPTITFIYSPSIVIGLIGICIVWLSLLVNKHAWVYLLSAFLVLSFFPFFSFFSISFTIGIGTFVIEIIPLALLITHVLQNIEFFKIKKDVQEEESEFQERVAYYIQKYSIRSRGELEKLNPDNLTKEAREALATVLNLKWSEENL